MLFPPSLYLLLVLLGRDVRVREVHVALVFLRVLQYDLNHRVLFPVVEFPLHFDVLVFLELQEAPRDLAIQHAKLTLFARINLGGCPSVLHYFPKSECRTSDP